MMLPLLTLLYALFASAVLAVNAHPGLLIERVPGNEPCNVYGGSGGSGGCSGGGSGGGYGITVITVGTTVFQPTTTTTTTTVASVTITSVSVTFSATKTETVTSTVTDYTDYGGQTYPATYPTDYPHLLVYQNKNRQTIIALAVIAALILFALLCVLGYLWRRRHNRPLPYSKYGGGEAQGPSYNPDAPVVPPPETYETPAPGPSDTYGAPAPTQYGTGGSGGGGTDYTPAPPQTSSYAATGPSSAPAPPESSSVIPEGVKFKT